MRVIVLVLLGSILLISGSSQKTKDVIRENNKIVKDNNSAVARVDEKMDSLKEQLRLATLQQAKVNTIYKVKWKTIIDTVFVLADSTLVNGEDDIPIPCPPCDVTHDTVYIKAKGIIERIFGSLRKNKTY